MSSSFSRTAVSKVQGSDSREAGYPADSLDINLSTAGHLTSYLSDTEDELNASIPNEPAPSANVSPMDVTKEVSTTENSHVPMLPRFISLSSGPDLWNLGDFFFTLGLYEEAFPCYEGVWSQVKNSQSDNLKLPAVAACVRSATTSSQLEKMTKENPELERAHHAIQSEVNFRDSNLNMGKIEVFLNVMLVLEAQNRIGGTANKDRIKVLRDPRLISNLLKQLPCDSRPVEFLVYYYIVNKLWSSRPTKSRFRETVGRLWPGFVNVKNLNWDGELRHWLEWCKNQLEEVILGSYDSRLLESCEMKEGLWTPEAVLFCLLWNAYKSPHGSSDSDNFKERMGFSMAQLFRAVATLITETVLGQLRATTSRPSQDGNIYISLAANAIWIVLQLPAEDLAYRFLEKLVYDEPLYRNKGDVKMREKLLQYCWAMIEANTDGLRWVRLPTPITSTTGEQRNSILVSENNMSTENDRKDDGRNFAQEMESLTSGLADKGGQCKSEDLTGHKDKIETEQEIVSEAVPGVRSSIASRESRVTWTQSLSSSNRSFLSFKATWIRSKQDSRSSRNSFNSVVNRLSDRLSIMSVASGEQESRYSRDSSVRRATMIIDEVDERDIAGLAKIRALPVTRP